MKLFKRLIIKTKADLRELCERWLALVLIIRRLKSFKSRPNPKWYLITTDYTTLGVNDEVNKSTKKGALKLMAGGPTKINPPNSHPSNPIHKEAMQPEERTPQPEDQTPQPEEQKPDSTETHENNKVAVAIGAVGVAAFIYFMR